MGCIQKFKVTEISLSKSCSWDALAEYGIVLNSIEKVQEISLSMSCPWDAFTDFRIG